MASPQVDILVDIRGDETVRRAARLLSRRMSDVAAIRQITRAGAKPITDAIQTKTPVLKKGTKHHYNYKGKRKATFLKGHLRLSTRDVSQVKTGYRKFPNIYIGPIYTGGAGSGGTFTGVGKNVDAYYAHMVLGGAAVYERKVIQAGFNAARTAAAQKVLKKAENVIKKEGQKSGFETS